MSDKLTISEAYLYEFNYPNVCVFNIKVSQDPETKKWDHINLQAYNSSSQWMPMDPVVFANLLQWLVGINQRIQPTPPPPISSKKVKDEGKP